LPLTKGFEGDDEDEDEDEDEDKDKDEDKNEEERRVWTTSNGSITVLCSSNHSDGHQAMIVDPTPRNPAFRARMMSVELELKGSGSRGAHIREDASKSHVTVTRSNLALFELGTR
jgi:hypothetical protein